MGNLEGHTLDGSVRQQQGSAADTAVLVGGQPAGIAEIRPFSATPKLVGVRLGLDLPLEQDSAPEICALLCNSQVACASGRSTCTRYWYGCVREGSVAGQPGRGCSRCPRTSGNELADNARRIIQRHVRF